MTRKIFYENTYKECWNSEILEIIPKENKFLIVLDETPFYPEGGGQPCDIGTIDDIEVLEVLEENKVIYHVINEKPNNKKVKCNVDFQRRFDYMQQHTGEHLLSAAFLKLYNGSNKGFHLGDDYVTIDIDLNEVTSEMVKKVENEVNNYIYLNAEVYTYIVSKKELENIPIRKKVKVDSDIRIVHAKDLDCSACCGLHVARTGEVGIVKIIKTEKNKGMTRVYFKCGKRALEDYNYKHDIVRTCSSNLNTEANGIVNRVEQQVETIKELNKMIKELNVSLCKQEVNDLIYNFKSNIIIKNYEEKSFEDVQFIAKELENRNYTLVLSSYILILSSLIDKQVLFMNDGRFDIKCGKFFKEHLSAYNGKGGGNDRRAQGAFLNKEDVLSFTEFLYSECLKFD